MTPQKGPDTEEETPELITVTEAADLAGVTISAIRKRYRSGDLERRYDDHGRVLLAAGEVRRLYGIAAATPQKGTPVTPAAAPEVPEGSVLVPLSAWEKTLEQLGNLHRAGQDLADARERAARAEEREAFAQERRREAETRVRALEEELDDRARAEPEDRARALEAELDDRARALEAELEDRARALEAELDALRDDRTEPVSEPAPGWWRRLWT